MGSSSSASRICAGNARELLDDMRDGNDDDGLFIFVGAGETYDEHVVNTNHVEYRNRFQNHFLVTESHEAQWFFD